MPHNIAGHNKISLSFAKSSHFDCYFSLAILDEIITLQMIIGGIILLLASELPFIRKQFQ
jgi:hypothetical protein